MSDPVWPATLPSFNRSNYSVSYNQPLARTNMEQGPQRVGRTSDNYTIDVNVSMIMNSAQQPIFWAFYNDDANAGQAWIVASIDTGTGLANHRVRIINPSFSFAGIDHQLTMQLETEERNSPA